MIWMILACADPLGPAPEADAGEDQRVWVGESLRLDGHGSEGVSHFSWSFGDGEHATGSSAVHTWDSPGRYEVYLEVQDEAGRSDTDSLTVVVAHQPLDPAPMASSSVALHEGVLYAVMPDLDAVALLDVESGDLLGHLQTCDQPRSVGVGEGLVAVTCAGDGRLDLFDRHSFAHTAQVELGWGTRPFAVIVRPGGIWVTLQGTGELLRLSLDGVEELRVPIAPDIRGLAWSEGRFVVTRYRSPDEGGQLWIVDSEGELLTQASLSLDDGPDSDTNSGGLPNLLDRPVARPDGRVLAVGGVKDNIRRGLYLNGSALTFETTARAVLRQIVLNEAEGVIGAETTEPAFDNRDRVAALAFSPTGDVLWSLQAGSGMLDALDPWDGSRLGGFQGLDPGVDGLLISPDGLSLWVSSPLYRALLRFDISDLSAAPQAPQRLDLLGELQEPLSEAELLGQQLFAAAGDRRMSQDGYLSCASCHPEGDHDGRTWDFTDRGEGMRNTISLLGQAGAAPIHWSANFDEVQDFENDIRGPMAGTGFLSDEDWAECSDTLGPSKAGRSVELDALAAYVESLDEAPPSPVRDAEGALDEAALRGQALFESEALGCTVCHIPPMTTDSAWLSPGQPLLHDVGTLSAASGQRRGEALLGLDTPALRGVANSAPYLHDGSAPDVRAVLLDRNTEDLHGVCSDLSEQELEDLERYLLSL